MTALTYATEDDRVSSDFIAAVLARLHAGIITARSAYDALVKAGISRSAALGYVGEEN